MKPTKQPIDISTLAHTRASLINLLYNGDVSAIDILAELLYDGIVKGYMITNTMDHIQDVIDTETLDIQSHS